MYSKLRFLFSVLILMFLYKPRDLFALNYGVDPAKPISIGAHLGLLSQGVHLGYALWEGVGIELGQHQYSTYSSRSTNRGERNYYIVLQYYLGKIFHYKAGLQAKTIDVDCNNYWSSCRQTFNALTYGLRLAMGIHFRFSFGLGIGGEIISFYQPLTASVTEEKRGIGPATGSQRNRVEAQIMQGNFGLLPFYIDYAF